MVNKETVSGEKKQEEAKRKKPRVELFQKSVFLTRKKGAELFSNFFPGGQKVLVPIFHGEKSVCVRESCIKK